MSSLQQSVPPVRPSPIRRVYRACKKWFRTHVADRVCFPVWLGWQWLRYRQRVVILHRTVALGDVVCTLPMCAEIRKQHPGRRLVYVTSASYQKMVRLSGAVDAVYGARAWTFVLPQHFFGLIERIYRPQTSEERTANVGTQSHLIDDLANSCNLSLTHRQPQLFPTPELIQKTCTTYGLATDAACGRLIIGINCGRTWPVRMWKVEKWQQLVNLLHADYEVTILQFGLTGGAERADEYDQIQGVISVTNRLKSDELVALVASCRLLISIDSGPVHVAGAVGVPVIGLFGAVNPWHRLPPESPAVGLFAEVPCRFCHHADPIKHWQSGCPNNIRCMEELDVRTVFQAVKTMLTKN